MPPRFVHNPPNPWHDSEVEYDLGAAPRAKLKIFEDASRSILARNDSPDLGFNWSVNPYRGCVHGCGYCYARPSHQHLDFGAGTDFERKLVVKREAPALLRRAFDRPRWKGEFVIFSGVTDCYQALEASYGITRACLEVCLEYRNPLGIVTKSPLVARDVDLLAKLAAHGLVSVSVSIPVWDPAHARAIEPWVAPPKKRMEAIAILAEAGIPVGVNVAPMIPGLSDEDMPTILAEAAKAGAQYAALIFLRLPGAVKDVFEPRLREALPLRADRIMSRIREARGGKLNDPRFGNRMRGEGHYAKTTRALFDATCRRLGLSVNMGPSTHGPSPFRRPPKVEQPSPQLGLF